MLSPLKTQKTSRSRQNSCLNAAVKRWDWLQFTAAGPIVSRGDVLSYPSRALLPICLSQGHCITTKHYPS